MKLKWLAGLLLLVASFGTVDARNGTPFNYYGIFNAGSFVNGNANGVVGNDGVNYSTRTNYVQYAPHNCCGQGATAMCGAPSLISHQAFAGAVVYSVLACSKGITTSDWTGTTIEFATSTDGNHYNFVAIADFSAVCSGSHVQAWIDSLFHDTDNSLHGIILCCPDSNGSPLVCHDYMMDLTDFRTMTWSTPVQISGTGYPTSWLNPYVISLSGTCYMFYKNDDAGQKFTQLATNSSCVSPTGWVTTQTGNWAGQGSPRETVQIINLGNNNLQMNLDKEGAGYNYGRSTNGPLGPWSAPAAMSGPFQMQHGYVFVNPFPN